MHGKVAPLHPGGRRKRGEDFEEKVVEWKAKTTHNSFADFKVFFIARDNMIRDQDKYKRTLCATELTIFFLNSWEDSPRVISSQYYTVLTLVSTTVLPSAKITLSQSKTLVTLFIEITVSSLKISSYC